MLYGEIIRQHLKLINEHVVADTIDYLEMKFTFQTDDWDGLEKWAHFSKNGTVYDIRLTDDCIRKEDHLNLGAGVWKVYLHGNEYRNGEVRERITTCVENLRVYPTGTLAGEPFPEMPASVTEQILARLEDIEQNGTGGGSGTVTSVAGVVPDETGNVPLTAEDIGAAEIEITDEEVNLVTVAGTAAVGQIIVVESVDGDGYPASWRAVDLPSGGGPSVEIDDTLTKSGKAADAAIVGQKLTEQSEAIADKANKAGWTPDKYIGTDAEGNIIEKDAPTGGDGWTIDELTAETEIADDDTLPFYDTSAKGQRKTLWGNIKAVLKTYFDTVYLKLSGGTLIGKIVLPTDNQNVGFTNSGDVKIFGYGNVDSVSHLRIGDATRPVQLRGSTERPKYNDGELALKSELDTALGSYITDIDALVGGDA